MSRKKIGWLLAGGVALMGALGALALKTGPQVPPLLPKATKIASVGGAHPFYWWLSKEEVLLFRDPSKQDYTLLRRNIATSAETPLTALSDLYRQTGGTPETLLASPDGKWLLWTGSDKRTHLATPDGKTHRRVKPRGPSRNIWMLDSERWVELNSAGENYSMAVRRFVDMPQEGQPIALAPSIPNDANLANLPHIASTDQEQLIVHYWNGATGQTTPARVMMTGFGASSFLAKKLTLTPPHENERGDLVFDPLSGRVGWILEFQQSFSRLRQKLSLSSAPPTHFSTGLWVTKFTGEEKIQLGCLDSVRGDPNSGPYNVQWTPDGARLSFIYQNALWTVPIRSDNS